MSRQKLFFALTMLFPLATIGQTSTLSSGTWSDPTNWSSGVPTSTAPATINDSMDMDVSLNINTGADYVYNDDMIDVTGGGAYFIQLNNSSSMDINAVVKIEGQFILKQTSTLYIRSNDTLRVGGNFSSGQNTYMEIEPGGVLYIEGSMDLNNSTLYQIDGNIYVEGDFESSNSASIAGSGNIEVEGTITMNNTSNVFGNTGDCNPGPCELGSGNGLPIRLMSLSAISYDQFNLKVDWTTISEINNEYFRIEISADGFEYKNLADISGAGNSQDQLNYSIVRPNPFPGTNKVYIKLSQFDYDGETESFNPIVVFLNNTSQSNGLTHDVLNIYPNPNNGDNFKISANDLPLGTYKVQIVDISGRILENKEFYIDEEQSHFMMDVNPTAQLNSGFYLVRLIGEQIEFTERLSIMR